MGALYMIIGTLVALGVLVTFHEYGHFWVARRCGVKVLRFSVGFGRPLVRWHDRHGTEQHPERPAGGGAEHVVEQDAEVVGEVRRRLHVHRGRQEHIVGNRGDRLRVLPLLS